MPKPRNFRGLARTARTYLSIFGARGLLYIAYCAFRKSKKPVRVARRWSSYPLYVRINSSDISVFRQVFIEREYAILDCAPPPRGGLIIDGGANIGLTSIFLAERFPGITVVAVEPDEGNFRMLQANVAPYSRIRCVQGALWNHDGTVQIADANSADWAVRVQESPSAIDADIPAIRLATLFDQMGVDRVDVLKLDVEGAECELLLDAASWLPRVDTIVVELHERLRPGCEALFAEATEAFRTIAVGRELKLVSRL